MSKLPVTVMNSWAWKTYASPGPGTEALRTFTRDDWEVVYRTARRLRKHGLGPLAGQPPILFAACCAAKSAALAAAKSQTEEPFNLKQRLLARRSLRRALGGTSVGGSPGRVALLNPYF